MQEVDVVLLEQRKLPAVLKDIAVFKAGFHTEEELLLGGTELGTETEAERTVLVTYQSLLIDQSAIPIVTLPKSAAGGFLPMVPHFTISCPGRMPKARQTHNR